MNRNYLYALLIGSTIGTLSATIIIKPIKTNIICLYESMVEQDKQGELSETFLEVYRLVEDGGNECPPEKLYKVTRELQKYGYLTSHRNFMTGKSVL